MRWIVECKHWKSRVPKEKVLAFHQIAQDIGADKAFLLSETGFQAGAVRVARKTNIVLTSLSGLRQNTAELAQELVIAPIAKRLEALNSRVQGYVVNEHGGPGAPPGVSLDRLLDLSGVLLMLRLALGKVLAGEIPVYGHTMTGQSVPIESVGAFVEFAEREMTVVVDALARADAAAASTRLTAREQYGPLAGAVRELLLASEILAGLPDKEGGDSVEIAQRALGAMQGVGRQAERLQGLVQGAPLKKLKILMRCLIDGVYLDLAQKVPDSEKFRTNHERALRALTELRQEISRLADCPK